MLGNLEPLLGDDEALHKDFADLAIRVEAIEMSEFRASRIGGGTPTIRLIASNYEQAQQVIDALAMRAFGPQAAIWQPVARNGRQ